MTPAASLEQALAPLAASADRANKPVSLLTIPALVVLIAAGYALYSFRGLATAKALVARRESDSQRLVGLVDSIKKERTKGVNVASLYPEAPFFLSQVQDSWKPPRLAPTLREPPQLGAVTTSTVLREPAIIRSEVQVTINSEPLKSVLDGVDTTLRHEFLQNRAFVSFVQLTPSGDGWRSVFRFTIYHVPTQ